MIRLSTRDRWGNKAQLTCEVVFVSVDGARNFKAPGNLHPSVVVPATKARGVLLAKALLPAPIHFKLLRR